MGVKTKNWFQKLQPGKLITPIVERFVPGGRAIVGAYQNVEHAIKRTVTKAPIREQAAEASVRGVPLSQVAAEQTAIAQAMYPASAAVAAPMPTVAIVAGVGVLLVLFLMRRKG